MKYFFFVFLSVLFIGHSDAKAQKADIIVTNGKITTFGDTNEEVQAVAIAGSKIIRTGANSEVLKLKGKQTKVIDAGGRRVIPGLFDSHLHVIRGGRFYNTELRWDGVTTLKKALQMLKEQAQRTPDGQWIRVKQFRRGFLSSCRKA